MQEITPELISAIATRLYNEQPSAAPASAMDATPHGAEPPSTKLPEGLGENLASTISLPVRNGDRKNGDWQPSVPASVEKPVGCDGPFPLVHAGNFDGLRAFVRQIQSPSSGFGSGVFADDPARNRLERLFKSASGAAPYDAR